MKLGLSLPGTFVYGVRVITLETLRLHFTVQSAPCRVRRIFNNSDRTNNLQVSDLRFLFDELALKFQATINDTLWWPVEQGVEI